uniref:Transmembrane protein 64-like n=1 Tax=Crassostrea virginica TaxID=6565 RepID=A0A8B8EFB7_CRAVI|nr:transmembrane protein 64-like [Crassostrea virginica]XP_022338200.1 transmembrane protein 64-like [Crassostrea virginica]XP_022338201.1 transmembrane protein 64-like [Crassostrea virginica]XP_022338202.1 transmembrane protein 64-like [Crassostrea virginica]XP_022338203.1 transmembrane protein 64-like [Crassostrea virginica]
MVAEDNFNPVAMASCTDGFHFTVQHIHMRPQMFLGESSTLDEVFLSGRPQGHDRVDSTIPQDVELLLEKDTSVVDSSEQEDILGRSGPSCYQLSISSVILISIICILVVTCRNYVKDLLLWLEQTDPYISVFIFLLLFIVTSFPMAWGYILLMVAAGYLYGYLYGPMVVLICGTVGIIVAHVVMKNCCRDFIKRRFYNSKMEAVIKVVESSQGFKLIALSRLTPIPFGLQNGLFALTDISLWSYCAASTIGLLPTTVLNCYMGSTLRTMSDVLTDQSNQATGYLILSVQIMLTVVLLWVVIRKARSELKKTVEGQENPSIELSEITCHDSLHNGKVSNGVIRT